MRLMFLSVQYRKDLRQRKQKWMPRRPIRLRPSAEKRKSRGRVRGLVGVESAAAEDPTR
jgi:hypothetical protein